MNEYTPTQQRILAVLSDGMLHLREELYACLGDQDGDISSQRRTLTQHVFFLRKKLVLKGEDIVCINRDRALRYRHVRLLGSAYRE